MCVGVCVLWVCGCVGVCVGVGVCGCVWVCVGVCVWVGVGLTCSSRSKGHATRGQLIIM